MECAKQVDDSKVIEREIEMFDSEEPSKEDPLMWWSKRELLYPVLSKVAKKYLAPPASSVPSERIFSTAGTIVCKKRASLSSSNVDKLIFLNKNFDLF